MHFLQPCLPLYLQETSTYLLQDVICINSSPYFIFLSLVKFVIACTQIYFPSPEGRENGKIFESSLFWQIWNWVSWLFQMYIYKISDWISADALKKCSINQSSTLGFRSINFLVIWITNEQSFEKLVYEE